MATDWLNLSPDGLNRTRNVVRIPPSVRRAEYAQAVIANTRTRSQRAYMAGGVLNDSCEGDYQWGVASGEQLWRLR